MPQRRFRGQRHGAGLVFCALGLARFGAAAEPLNSAPETAPTPPHAAEAGTPDAPTSHVPDVDLLTFYKDNYLLTGFTYSREVKFQFSAKFDIWPNRSAHAVYFAFTQRSLWDVYRRSAPFVETNYAPELFYTYYHAPGRYEPLEGCRFFLERLGLAHESNGLVGPSSRSWNRAYVESRFACYDAQRSFLAITLQAWAPPFGTSDNPEIASYLGYGELSLGIGSDRGKDWAGDWEIAAHARKGTRAWRVGSLELDARWRPRYSEFWRFTPYLYGQAFTGYGETLLSYDRALTAIRVGIGFTDRSTRSE